MQKNTCPLCRNINVESFASDQHGTYILCRDCYGVFRPPENMLSAEREKARYLTHNNDLNDQRYLNFLRKLVIKISPYLEEGMLGLDFGCGPVKAMEHLFKFDDELGRKSVKIESYDPFFFQDYIMEEGRYDFILASEVVEHLYHPRDIFKEFTKWLRPGGYLGIMTQTRKEEFDFLSWSYRRDPTHVFFYHEKTFAWISEHFSLRLISQAKDQYIFKLIS